MPLSLGLGLGLTLGGGQSLLQQVIALNPVALFDISQLNTLFEERTGASATTPASVDGVVGTIKSVHNTVYLTAPSDAARPTLKKIGSRYYLKFDGSDDAFNFSLALPTSAGLAAFIAIGNETNFLALAHGGAGTTGAPFLFISENGSASDSYFNAGAPSTYINGRVIGPTRDELRDEIVNGSTIHVLTQRPITLSSSVDPHYSGCPGRYATGRLYGMCFLASATDENASLVESYFESISGSTQLPLDKISVLEKANVASAWSFRRLTASYSGALIRIRRDTDDVEQDFSGDTSVDTQEIDTFLAGGNGFVKTLYDQIGSNDLTQNTPALQPAYISEGINNKSPACNFNGTSHYMSADGLSSVFTGEDKPFTSIVVSSPDTTTGTQTAWSLGSSSDFNPFHAQDMTSGSWRIVKKDDAATILSTAVVTAAASDFVSTIRCDGTEIQSLNGISGRGVTVPNISLDVGTLTLDRFTVGALGRPSYINFMDGKISDIIMCSSALSDASVNIIMNDIQAYYDIVCPLSYTLSSPTNQLLPDALGSAAGKGFTCTGLADDTTLDAWWCGNDGREDSGDSSYEPSIVRVSRDGSTNQFEIDLGTLFPSMQSVQGVTIDTTDNTLWIASVDENLIRNVSKAGSNIGSFSKTGPNGLCYDSKRDRLWYVGTGPTLYRIDKAGLEEYSLGLTEMSSVDHLFYDSDRDLIWISYGSNGSEGVVCSFSPSTGIIGKENYILNDSLAIEGIIIKDDTLYVLNDAYFHGVSPNLNQFQAYGL